MSVKYKTQSSEPVTVAGVELHYAFGGLGTLLEIEWPLGGEDPLSLTRLISVWHGITEQGPPMVTRPEGDVC